MVYALHAFIIKALPKNVLMTEHGNRNTSSQWSQTEWKALWNSILLFVCNKAWPCGAATSIVLFTLVAPWLHCNEKSVRKSHLYPSHLMNSWAFLPATPTQSQSYTHRGERERERERREERWEREREREREREEREREREREMPTDVWRKWEI